MKPIPPLITNYSVLTYSPERNLIAAITQANPVVITTTTNHGYIDGEIVRLEIPLEYGIQEIDGLFGTVTVLTPTTFSLTIDSSIFSVFNAAVTGPQEPQTIPIGEINSILTAATHNIL